MQLADSSYPISPLWSDNRGNFWGDNSGVCSHRICMPGEKLNKGWEYRIWHVVWGYQASWFQRKGSYEKEYLPEDVKWDMLFYSPFIWVPDKPLHWKIELKPFDRYINFEVKKDHSHYLLWSMTSCAVGSYHSHVLPSMNVLKEARSHQQNFSAMRALKFALNPSKTAHKQNQPMLNVWSIGKGCKWTAFISSSKLTYSWRESVPKQIQAKQQSGNTLNILFEFSEVSFLT